MIYDIHTKNRSFLETSVVLKNHGVKNCYFMLQLFDESLVGVDPYSPDLTPEQKVRIYAEIRKNKWYFLREVYRLQDQGNENGIQYKLNIGNLAQSYCQLLNINFISLLPRQVGKTQGVLADITWVTMFATNNTDIIFMNKQFPDAIENGKRYETNRMLLPKWLRDIVLDREDTNNQDKKRIAKLKNTILIKPAATSVDQAEKLGRGLTCPILFFDEFAFLKHNNLVFNSAFPAWNTASENAKRNNSPYSIMITTTPNNIDTAEGEYCHRILDESCKFQFEFYDYSEKEIKDYMKTHAKNPTFMHIQYTWKECGKSDEWYEKAKAACEKIKLRREYDLEWTKSTDDSVFTEEQLDLISEYVKKPIFELSIQTNSKTETSLGALRKISFYEKPDFNKHYLVGVDVATGLSQDNSAITIIDPFDFHVVGDFMDPKIDTDSFRNLIEQLVTMYFSKAILIIERNSVGTNILDIFMKNPKIEPRLYREVKERTAERVIQDGINVKSKNKTLVYGVITDKSSRAKMFDMLPSIVDDEYRSVCSPRLYADIKHLVKVKGGRIEADKRFHDDILMSYLIVRYAIFYGRFLQDRFGINSMPSTYQMVKNSSSKAALKLTAQLKKEDQTNIDNRNDLDSYLTYIKEEETKIKKAEQEKNGVKSSTILSKFAKWNS